MKITKLERAPEGYWQARVGGTPVDRRFGVWGTPPDEDGRWKLVRLPVAQRLQAQVNTIETRERRAVTA